MSFDFRTFSDASNYNAFRTEKLQHYPLSVENITVEVRDPAQLSTVEREQMARCLAQTNMVIYRVTDAEKVDKTVLTALGRQWGLTRIDTTLCTEEDGITALQVVSEGQAHEYIPYTNQPLNWHTDGYYNALDSHVLALLMYCVRPSVSGGENAYIDPDIAYIHLRDTNPDFITALMAADAMTIPANQQGDVVLRPAQSSAVFSFTKDGQLNMRYTVRKRHIQWADRPLVREAVACLNEFLNSDTQFHVRYRLHAGEGVLCNNVLHNRTGFTDGDTPDTQRLLYRIRYYDRVVI
ncbi:TauD/TfdA family dioxygenase [Thioflexithrix psekupsensis]|uniref:TauD/TfdA-like domain-containing protein n=1 Tax=Thioflexithrix psekupsensis TaxID=1570016 RepID=A0A251X7W4_9GAMM|nr:TauD/TfdA family dioxygenase [Thioflexithrix psekupsensis]OUD14086.1 hypothetical protein TPSD3_07030 [Thioflexithrix psekupsensis]